MSAFKDDFENRLMDMFIDTFHTTCPSCNASSIGQSVRYCTHCGTLNPKFKESVLEWQWETTLQQAVEKECRRDHPDIQASISESPDYDEQYCPHCGSNLEQYYQRLSAN